MNAFNKLNQDIQPLFALLIQQAKERIGFSEYEYFYTLEKCRTRYRILRQEREVVSGKVFDYGCEIVGFVEENGDVYKATGKSPARGVRGNIYEDIRTITDGFGFIRYS